ncbi:MAG: hypothetical protein ABIC95_03455 [archaeon]
MVEPSPLENNLNETESASNPNDNSVYGGLLGLFVNLARAPIIYAAFDAVKAAGARIANYYFGLAEMPTKYESIDQTVDNAAPVTP